MPGGHSAGGDRRWWFLAALVAVLSLAEYRVTVLLHQAQWREAIAAAWGVTVGQPHWAEYQNRLLGPWLARGASSLAGISFASAFLGTVLLLHLAKNLLCFLLVRRLTGDPVQTGRAVLAGIVLFLALQDSNWTYLWDYLDVVVFLLFCYGALARRGNLYFALLFLPALLNRESALFIPLWLALDAFTLKDGPSWRIPRLRDPRRLLLGAGLFAAGVAAISLARKSLLVAETAAAFNPEFAAEAPFHLARNLNAGWWALTHPNFDLAFLPLLAATGTLAGLLLLLPRLDELRAKLAAVALGMLVMICVVGLVNETRVFSMLVPFAVMIPVARASTREVPP